MFELKDVQATELVDLYFGPYAPAGETAPGKGVRLYPDYGPEQPSIRQELESQEDEASLRGLPTLITPYGLVLPAEFRKNVHIAMPALAPRVNSP